MAWPDPATQILPCRFVGRVVDEGGQAVASASVAILPPRDLIWLAGLSTLAVPEPPLLHLSFVRVEANGCFDVTRDIPRVRELHGSDDPFQFGLGEFDPHLVVRAPGMVLRIVGGEYWEGGTLAVGDVVMRSGSIVSGRVLNEHGEPRAGVLVNVDGRKDTPWAQLGDWLLEDLTSRLDGITDEQGRFETVGYWEGEVRIHAIEESQERGELEALGTAHVSAGGTADVGDLILRQAPEQAPNVDTSVDWPPSTTSVLGTGTIRGHARHLNGDPAAGEWLAVLRAGNLDPPLLRVVRCDARGAFVVRDWPGGTWRLRSQPGGQMNIDLPSGKTVEVDFEVPGYPIVRGHVFEHGQPVAGWSVHTGYVQGGETGSDGSYDMPLKGPGVEWICFGEEVRRWVIASRWGEVITLDVDVDVPGVEGLVQDAKSRKPVANAQVTLEGASGRYDGRSNEHGIVTIYPVQLDAYVLHVSAPGYAPRELGVDLHRWRFQDLFLQLDPQP